MDIIKRKCLGKGRVRKLKRSMTSWSDEELLFLQEHWGNKSVTLIAKHLERSYGGVRRKANELGLLCPLLHYDGISVNQLISALKISYITMSIWIERHNFPSKQKVFNKKRRILVVSYGDFWTWAEKHQHLINLARMEPLILGKEPEWAKEKRKIDRHKIHYSRPWTNEEKQRLVSLVLAYRYTYPQIAHILKRSESSIKEKLQEMNIKARPVSLDKRVKYTDQEIQTILWYISKGYSFCAIADTLNQDKPPERHKSACGIRGKLERMGFSFRDGKAIVYPEEHRVTEEPVPC